MSVKMINHVAISGAKGFVGKNLRNFLSKNKIRTISISRNHFKKNHLFYMAEDYELCTFQKHHKQKILLFLSAMRSYADTLKKNKYKIEYGLMLHGFDSKLFYVLCKK